uniref:Si:ch73-212j7.3 n=1 Tax=Stegastes partitus TaxID=144197 RepID=A0A3B5AD32_9TELE
CDVLQHSDSEGVLVGDRRSLQPAVSSSTLGSSSLGESETDRPAQEEEDGDELGSRKDSLERLMCSEEEEDDEAGRLDEVLLEDEQVEDFASSVLAEPCSATPDSDSKTLSSGESSEEEDEKEAAEKVLKSPSILPSSVLDKASAIAQHFTNSIKRGSLAQDDTRSLGCASPRLPSRTGSSLSLCAEPADRPLRLNSISSDSVETFSVTDLTMLSPRDDSLFDADRGIRRRRDSTLSKQDQLLIGKIKTYYENAGNQDATFSLQRRESLTYIPTGLVRSSVSRLNSIPRDETVQTNPSTNRMVSSESLDSLKSQSMQDNPFEDEDFRPSSEMIKIWQAMEREITKSQSDDGGRDRSREALRISRATGGSNLTKCCDQESTASDLSTITEESTSPSPLKSKVSGVNRTGSLKDALKVFGEEAVVLRAPVPRVIQLRAESERERPRKSKVLHLARQYSQRIKTSKPVVRQRSQGLLIAKKSLACVVEEKESTGTVTHSNKHCGPACQLSQQSDHTRSPTPGPTCSSVGGSRGVSPGRARSRSPLSPTPPVEGFNWPDVSELRSKYSDHGGSQKTSVSRSRSIPEQMFDGSLRSEGPSYKPRGSRDTSREEPKEPKEEDDDKLDKATAASTAQDVPQRSRSNSGQKMETGQKSIVKNLREKFQSLS